MYTMCIRRMRHSSAFSLKQYETTLLHTRCQRVEAEMYCSVPVACSQTKKVGNHCQQYRWVTKFGPRSCTRVNRQRSPVVHRWTSTPELEACQRRNRSIQSDQRAGAASRQSRSSSVADCSRRGTLVHRRRRKTGDQTDSDRPCF